MHAMYYQDDTLIYSKHLLHSFFFPVIFYLIVIGVGVGLTMAYLHLLSSFCEMSLCRDLTESVKTMTITVAPEINYYDLVYCTVVDRSS